MKRARAFSVLLYHCNHAAIVGFVVPVETQTRKLFAHKSVSSFVITEAESFNNLAHCQRVRQHKCARKRRERKRAACVVVYNMFSCWLKNNTNPWTAEFFFFMFMYYTAVLSQQYVCTFTHTSIPICTGREGFKRFSFRFRFLSQCRLC